jgi:Tfp pilus assembly protein PilX
MKNLALVLVLVALVLVGLVPLSSLSAQAQCAIDTAKITQLLNDAKTAADKGDTATATKALSEARTLIQKTENQCENTKTNAMASCGMVFDATVRKGASAGANVRGILSLVESKGGQFTGVLVPNVLSTVKLDDAAIKAVKDKVVTVKGAVANKQIELEFSLPGGASIKGVGPFDGNGLVDCLGALEGSLTGPKSDDVGDWLGAPTGGGRAACISRGVSACVRQYGANGSAACAAEVTAQCVALYQN